MNVEVVGALSPTSIPGAAEVVARAARARAEDRLDHRLHPRDHGARCCRSPPRRAMRPTASSAPATRPTGRPTPFMMYRAFLDLGGLAGLARASRSTTPRSASPEGLQRRLLDGRRGGDRQRVRPVARRHAGARRRRFRNAPGGGDGQARGGRRALRHRRGRRSACRCSTRSRSGSAAASGRERDAARATSTCRPRDRPGGATTSTQATRATARRGRAMVPAPVAVDALPRTSPSAPRASSLTDLQGPPHPRFPRQQRPPGRLRPPKVVAAIKAQLDRCPSARAATPIGRRSSWRERLVELAPGRFGKVLLAPSGSAAIGMALKLARYATGRHKTVSMWDAFHGANLDAISVGGEALFRKDVGPLLPGAEHVPPPGLAAPLLRRRRARARAAGRLHRLCARGPGRRRGGDRRADALDDGRAAAARILAEGARELRPSRHAADLRRDPELPRAATGTMFACEQVRLRARHAGDRQGPGRRHHAAWRP